MISIAVNSLPIADVIADISQAFETTHSDNCGFFQLDIPRHIGKGTICGINFDGGMGMVQYDCLFDEDVEFRFTLNEVHPLKFLYCLEGSLKHTFEDSKETNTINQYQEAIVASDYFNGHILRFRAGEHTIVNSIEITRKEFQRKVSCHLITLNDNLLKLFNDINATKSFYYEGFYSLKLADLLRSMQTFSGKDVLRNLFLEGLTYQLLTEQILQYEDDLQEINNRSILRQSEVEQIKMASDIINENITELGGINGIATAVGLNSNKLQEGFQILYNTTVNQYIQKVRLNLIKDLILNTEYNISEIVDLVGLSSKSYLSKIFKEEYGIRPSEYRKHYVQTLTKKKQPKSP